MTPKWISERRLRRIKSNFFDAPPVKTRPSGFANLISTESATISTFSHAPSKAKAILFSRQSSSKGTNDIACILTDLKANDTKAVESVSRETWADFCAKFASNQSHSLGVFFEILHAEVSKIGGESLPFEYLGASLDSKNSISEIFGSSGVSSVKVTSNSIKKLNESGLSVVSPLAFTETKTPIVCKAIAFAASADLGPLLLAAQSVCDIPYPVSGAAELTYFSIPDSARPRGIVWIEFDQLS
jgi:hypothetical protein